MQFWSGQMGQRYLLDTNDFIMLSPEIKAEPVNIHWQAAGQMLNHCTSGLLSLCVWRPRRYEYAFLLQFKWA
jgi:hypothetical protein